jgi:hypothetical protein
MAGLRMAGLAMSFMIQLFLAGKCPSRPLDF